MSDILLHTGDDGITVLTLNRPAKRNAVSLAMWREIDELLGTLAEDLRTRILIVTGSGGHFSAGADISEFGALRDTVENAQAYEEISQGAVRTLRDFPKPTIAAVLGNAIGGGCNLALACDFRIGDSTTRMGIPAARVGVVYPPEGCDLLMRLVGLANAKLVLFSGRHFDSAACLAMGLIDRLDTEAALPAALGLARELTAAAPLAQQGAKLVIEALAQHRVEARSEDIQRAIETAMASRDHAEARNAFMEKRSPVFKGH